MFDTTSSVTSEKPFEELASQWAPRARRFLSLVADQVSVRVKARLPGLVTGSAFLFAAIFCVGAIGAWLSTAAWSALKDHGFSASISGLIVAGGFLVFGVLFALAARSRALRPSGPPVEILDPENHEIEEAGQELITLFKDLTIAAKRSLSPNEVLKPHAVKVAVASTALGLLVALNLTARKERYR
jgi:hypothetical protein